MRGLFEGHLRNQPQTGVEYLKRALDLLQWGRTVWKDVPKSDRGVIFEDTFVVGVRSMYLKEFMEVGSEFLFICSLSDPLDRLIIPTPDWAPSFPYNT